MFSYVVRGFLGRSALQKMLRSHFAGASLAELATASRTFPITARVDLQTAVDELLTRRDETRLVGVHSQMNHETPTFAHLFTPGPFLFDLGPLQQDEIDIGERRRRGASSAGCGSRAREGRRLRSCHAIAGARPRHGRPRRVAPRPRRSSDRVSAPERRRPDEAGDALRSRRGRAAQFQLELGGGAELSAAAVDGAIEEMVFAGGSLNVKLLGRSLKLSEPSQWYEDREGYLAINRRSVASPPWTV